MALTTFFVDLDDTLYPSSCGIWEAIQKRMGLFMHDQLGIAWEEIPGLRRTYYQNYGTTARGLQIHYQIKIEDYLSYVHDVSIEDLIPPDPEIRKVLQAYPQRKIIFTNADRNHAERVLSALQIKDCFEGIVDIHQIWPECKPQPGAFEAALRITGESDPSRCLFIDDSSQNTATARALGFFTIQVCANPAESTADFVIPSFRDIAQVLPIPPQLP